MGCGGAEDKVEALDVLESHFFVMPWWVVLGEAVCQVDFSWFPNEIAHFLFDVVFHPPAAHVEGFGQFLVHH